MKNNKELAINGGTSVSDKFIVIHKPYMDEDDFKAVDETTRSTFISGDGPACRDFEKKIANYLGVKHALFMVSCTAALDLALRVKNFPEGSEVIVPNFTYTSTALAPLLNNLKLVLVDVNPLTGTIDVEKLESYITDKTVAIMPVDYAGVPADMDEVNRIAEKHNLFVVHDTAQSFGSEYKSKKTGNQASISTFSFHATKNLVTGEGGALVTNDDAIAERIKLMREKGTDKYSYLTNKTKLGYYEYVDIGNSYVAANILGALGVTQIKKIDWMNNERDKIANYYIKELSDVKGISMPVIPDYAKTNWHVFYIKVESGDVNWIMKALKAEGIHTNVHFSPLHLNKFYSKYGTDADFPGSMKFFRGLLRIPIYPSLTMQERKLVVEAVKKVMGKF